MKRFICAAVVTVAIAGTGLAAGAIAPQNQGLRSGTGAFAAYRGPGASAPIARRLATPGRRNGLAVAKTVVASGGGFDWGDATVGGGFIAGIVLLVTGARALIRRRLATP